MLNKIWRLFKELVSLCEIMDAKSYLFFIWSIFKNIPSSIKTKNLEAAHKAMWERQITFKIGGKKIILPGKWFGYAGEIYGRRVYTHFPQFCLKNKMTVIDLGAAGGYLH